LQRKASRRESAAAASQMTSDDNSATQPKVQEWAEGNASSVNPVTRNVPQRNIQTSPCASAPV